MPHGQMMDAAGAQPDDLPRAHWHLAQAALPQAEHPRRAPWPLLPAARAWNWQALATHVVGQQSAHAVQTAMLLPAALLDARTAAESLQMTVAVLQQWQSLQAQWIEGLTGLAQAMGEVRQVNTVSKFVDQESALWQRGLALVSAQATTTMKLVENVQVNQAWWLSQRAAPG